MDKLYSETVFPLTPLYQAEPTFAYQGACSEQREENLTLSTIAFNFRMRWLNQIRPVSTVLIDPWIEEQMEHDKAVTTDTGRKLLLIADLGWSKEEALEARLSLKSFEKDWNAPGMEEYDNM